MPQDQAQYPVARKAREAEGATSEPDVKGLPYGTKPIIKGVPQARGTFDRNLIDPFVPGKVKKPTETETKI